MKSRQIHVLHIIIPVPTEPTYSQIPRSLAAEFRVANLSENLGAVNIPLGLSILEGDFSLLSYTSFRRHTYGISRGRRPGQPAPVYNATKGTESGIEPFSTAAAAAARFSVRPR